VLVGGKSVCANTDETHQKSINGSTWRFGSHQCSDLGSKGSLGNRVISSFCRVRSRYLLETFFGVASATVGTPRDKPQRSLIEQWIGRPSEREQKRTHVDPIRLDIVAGRRRRRRCSLVRLGHSLSVVEVVFLAESQARMRATSPYMALHETKQKDKRRAAGSLDWKKRANEEKNRQAGRSVGKNG